MCNENRRRVALDLIVEGFSQLRIPLRFPEGMPNLEPLDSIRITDRNAIVRRAADGAADGAAELVMRRWSWPGPGGKPVYNFRSEGRAFGNSSSGGRCLIIADGFYEFTTPAAEPGAPEVFSRQAEPPDDSENTAIKGKPGSTPVRRNRGRARPKRKDKWLFTKKDEPWFCIAGIWRTSAEVGEAFTMLTTEPGPDVAPYHGRQIVVLDRADWTRWLDPRVPAPELLKPSPAGTFAVKKVGGPA